MLSVLQFIRRYDNVYDFWYVINVEFAGRSVVELRGQFRLLDCLAPLTLESAAHAGAAEFGSRA